MAKTPFTRTDATIAGGIIGTTLLLVAGILTSAEHVKRDGAEFLVEAIAAANQKRLAAGKPAVTGPVDDSSPLVVDGDLESQEWDRLPYVFSGAEEGRAPCILATAARRTDGPLAPAKPPYDGWGVCATAKGEVQLFAKACTIDCREPAPTTTTTTAPPTTAPPAQPAAPRVAKPITINVPQLAPEKDEPKEAGCSATGCFGTTCCDQTTDRCVSCPGNSCCEKGLGCSGTCQQDDDCAQGCHCVKLAGSPWGNCRGK